MTHDQMIEVIRAHRDGKVVQARNLRGGEWFDADSPCWDFASFEYRIKREPREFILRVFPDGSGTAFEPGSLVEISDVAAALGAEVIHVREVLK